MKEPLCGFFFWESKCASESSDAPFGLFEDLFSHRALGSRSHPFAVAL